MVTAVTMTTSVVALLLLNILLTGKSPLTTPVAIVAAIFGNIETISFLVIVI